MAGIVINISTQRLEEEEFEDVCNQLFDFLVELSPVDTGYFASQWEIDVSYPKCKLYNDTPYGEYLDQGWSNQAPDGLTRPALAFLADTVSDVIASRPHGRGMQENTGLSSSLAEAAAGLDW